MNFMSGKESEKHQEEIKKEESVLSPKEFYEAKLNDPDHILEKTNFNAMVAEHILDSQFGQADLSNIEKAKLREISEGCVKQMLEETILFYEGKMSDNKIIDVSYEIVYRWLWELYDIKRSDLQGRPHGNETLDIPEDFKEYLRRLRANSHLI